jgi:hypothetical protein
VDIKDIKLVLLRSFLYEKNIKRSLKRGVDVLDVPTRPPWS